MSVLEAVEDEKRFREQLCDLCKPLDNFKVIVVVFIWQPRGQKK